MPDLKDELESLRIDRAAPGQMALARHLAAACGRRRWRGSCLSQICKLFSGCVAITLSGLKSMMRFHQIARLRTAVSYN